MKESIFLIDDLGRVEAVLEKAVASSGLEVVSFTDIPAAKRRIIESPPHLIITLISFQNDVDGGYRIAHEISSHDVLSSVPVLLIADELSEEVIRRASESGARSLIPWPVTVDSLRSRLKSFLPAPAADRSASGAAPTASPAGMSAAEIRAAALPKELPNAESGSEQKIQLAQKLLAKVLHNLKTSALLEVIDLEDVPRVVYEISRAVCGVKTEEQKVPPAKGPSLSDERDTVLDLDAAFGLKK